MLDYLHNKKKTNALAVTLIEKRLPEPHGLRALLLKHFVLFLCLFDDDLGVLDILDGVPSELVPYSCIVDSILCGVFPFETNISNNNRIPLPGIL